MSLKKLDISPIYSDAIIPISSYDTRETIRAITEIATRAWERYIRRRESYSAPERFAMYDDA
jgi:hypothetical protein